jgi:phosphoribosylformimino-5-aminoimidazole carboxamide ribonucleotide (ProFAR) isomerase
VGLIDGLTAPEFGADAIALALENAGLTTAAVDGCRTRVTLNAALMYGFTDLNVYNIMYAAGATVGTMMQHAASAIESGDAHTVVLVYAGGNQDASGIQGLPRQYGFYGAIAPYAMAAMRHTHLHGTKASS